AGPVWRADSRPAHIEGRMVDRRHDHLRHRRAAGRHHEPREGGPASGTGGGATASLAAGTAPLADLAKRAGAGRTRRGFLLPVVRRYAAVGICRAGGTIAW